MKVNYLFEYLPTRYSATESEKQNRIKVWNFKNGNCSEEVYSALKQRIERIIESSSNQWVVVFAPASTPARTEIRFRSLAHRLDEDLTVSICFDGFYNISSRVAAHEDGIRGDVSNVETNKSVFSNKKVLIIDDVVTSGKSLMALARKAMSAGAIYVEGLVVAKTVNPDWISQSA